MQLKQTYSKYYGQIEEEMKGSLNEDPEFERAHQEKDVLKLRKILKNINFNYKRSEEPIKTLWQADKDFINLRQHKMDLTTYFEKFKATKKVVKELNQSANGNANAEIMCRELDINPDDIEEAEATKFIADGKERILGIELIMNADRDMAL